MFHFMFIQKDLKEGKEQSEVGGGCGEVEKTVCQMFVAIPQHALANKM